MIVADRGIETAGQVAMHIRVIAGQEAANSTGIDILDCDQLALTIKVNPVETV